MPFLQLLYETFSAMSSNTKKIKISKSEAPCIHRVILYIYIYIDKKKEEKEKKNVLLVLMSANKQPLLFEIRALMISRQHTQARIWSYRCLPLLPFNSQTISY